jgi:hypothetical protein
MHMAKPSGRSIIGFRQGEGAGQPIYATDPTTGQRLQPGFVPANTEEVELAVRLGADAVAVYC